MLKVKEFILNHPDNWEDILDKEFKVKTSRKGDYFLLKYKPEADFGNEIVRECRGIIFYAPTLEPVCVPFFKFENYCSLNADKIDWGSARVLEKIDGSLIKLWFHLGKWHISTNGTIDAEDAPCLFETFSQIKERPKNFGELFWLTYSKNNYNFLDKLVPGNTYMLEMVGPFNQVVIYYPNLGLYHLGTRDNHTLCEKEEDIGLQKPKEYPLTSLQDCISVCEGMTKEEEGFVVVDKDYHRIKVKNPLYIMIHYCALTQNSSYKRLVDVVLNHEENELLGYFPQYKEQIDLIRTAITNFYQVHYNLWQELSAKYNEDKEFALALLEKTGYDTGLIFSLKKKEMSLEEFYDFCLKHKNTTKRIIAFLEEE